MKIQSELAYKPNKRERQGEITCPPREWSTSNRLNNFPISVSQLAEGMNNAGSMLESSGNSLEQSIALLTSANTTVNMCRAA